MLLKIAIRAWMITAALHPLAQQAPGALKGFEISGTLVDANTGQPVQRARVAIAATAQGNDFTTVITRDDGQFVFANLAPGKYTLTAQARGYLLQSFNQHDQFSSSVVVGPNLDSAGLVFRLPPEGSISGVVLDEAGEPVRDAEVMLYATGLSSGEQVTRGRGRASTNDEGAYHFGHLASGRYLVAVLARPWYAQHQARVRSADDPEIDPQLDVAYPVTFNGGATDAGSVAPIVLGRGDKVTADVTLQPAPALHVRLRHEGAAGQDGYTAVEMRLFDGAVPLPILSFREGGEVASVPPGHYTLRRFAGANDPGELSREVDINASGEIDGNQGSSYVPVSAKLQLEAGMTPGQITVQLLNKRSRQITAERLGPGGEMALKQGVPPGTYELSLSSDSGMYVKSISASGAAVVGRTIEIRPGNAVKLTINAAAGEGEVKGTVLRGDRPFPGAMILLVPADPGHNQVLFRRDQSNTDGSFTIAAVVPGAYTLLAIENGWDLEWAKPEVLKNYLAAGVAVRVQAGGKNDIKVQVQ